MKLGKKISRVLAAFSPWLVAGDEEYDIQVSWKAPQLSSSAVYKFPNIVENRSLPIEQ